MRDVSATQTLAILKVPVLFVEGILFVKHVLKRVQWHASILHTTQAFHRHAQICGLLSGELSGRVYTLVGAIISSEPLFQVQSHLQKNLRICQREAGI